MKEVIDAGGGGRRDDGRGGGGGGDGGDDGRGGGEDGGREVAYESAAFMFNRVLYFKQQESLGAYLLVFWGCYNITHHRQGALYCMNLIFKVFEVGAKTNHQS